MTPGDPTPEPGSLPAGNPEQVGRRQFWKLGLRGLASTAGQTLRAYWAGQHEVNPPPPPLARTRVRPPGAVAEADFRRLCTGCGDCGKRCPFGALQLDDAGLPWLADPAGHPCYMCDAFPCIAACETGALTFRDARLRVIGRAVIAQGACLAHQGQSCTACFEACRDARAIAVADGLPSIEPDRCTGCALCVGKCPVPGALTLRPLA